MRWPDQFIISTILKMGSGPLRNTMMVRCSRTIGCADGLWPLPLTKMATMYQWKDSCRVTSSATRWTWSFLLMETCICSNMDPDGLLQTMMPDLSRLNTMAEIENQKLL